MKRNKGRPIACLGLDGRPIRVGLARELVDRGYRILTTYNGAAQLWAACLSANDVSELVDHTDFGVVEVLHLNLYPLATAIEVATSMPVERFGQLTRCIQAVAEGGGIIICDPVDEALFFEHLGRDALDLLRLELTAKVMDVMVQARRHLVAESFGEEL